MSGAARAKRSASHAARRPAATPSLGKFYLPALGRTWPREDPLPPCAFETSMIFTAIHIT